jgi:hypothetical protein
MNSAHQELAAGKWLTLSFLEQMANIGSEVERAIKWKNKGNADFFQLAFTRAIQLLDFSLADKKNNARLKELVRIRETLADYFLFNNQYGSSDEKWRRYFYCFNYAARKDR